MITSQIDGINIAAWIKKEWTVVLFALISLFPRKLCAQGTTPFIKEIMIGRCLDYQHTHRPELVANGQTKNCTQLWLQFKQGFSGKSQCSTSPEDFSSFLDSAYIPVPTNKAIMWTGTGGTVHDYASDGKRFYTVSDTLAGFMVNNLHFCSQESSPGINYNKCPGWTECISSAERSFWGAISKKFAEGAEGEVPVMLNGTSGAAYRSDSIFTKFELPNLNKEKVKVVKAYLVYRMGQTKRETCDSGTMLKLKEDAEKFGLDYTCTENPSDIMYLLCVDDVKAQECKMISQILGYTSTAQTLFSQLYLSISILSTCFIIKRQL